MKKHLTRAPNVHGKIMDPATFDHFLSMEKPGGKFGGKSGKGGNGLALLAVVALISLGAYFGYKYYIDKDNK